MAQLFIPQAPDLLGPAFNLQRLRQSQQQIEQQGEQHKALQQYRQDLIDERDLNAVAKFVNEGQIDAAKQLFLSNPNLARRVPDPNFSASTKPMTTDQLKAKLAIDLAGGKNRTPTTTLEALRQVADKSEQATNREDRLAHGEGYSSFEKAPLDIKRKINAQVQTDRVAISAAQGAAGVTSKAKAESNLPLNEKSIYWLNKDTGLPADPRQTEREVRDSGKYQPVDPKQLSSAQTARSALAQLNQYEKLIPKLFPKSSGNFSVDQVKIRANQLRMNTVAGDPAINQLRTMQSFIVTMAKAAGDTGNVALAERLLQIQGLISDANTQESANASIVQVRTLLNDIIKSKGIPVPGTTKDKPPPDPTEGGLPPGWSRAR